MKLSFIFIIFVITSCSSHFKTYRADDVNRHQMIAHCSSSPDQCREWYSNIVFKTRRDLRRYLKSLYQNANYDLFLKIVEDSIPTHNHFIYPAKFGYINGDSNKISESIFITIDNHNQSYIETLENKEDLEILMEMMEKDQEIRRKLVEEIETHGMTDKFMELNTKMGVLDSLHENNLMMLDSWRNIDAEDIGSKIGNVGIKSIFYIVQHSGNHAAMKKLLTCKYLTPFDRFRLTDRLRVENGKTQLYGTQYDRDGILLPIKNRGRANKSRIKYGLLSLESEVAGSENGQ